MSEEQSWIYGVVPGGSELTGLDRRLARLGTEVWVVERGDLGAIASAPPSDGPKGTSDRALVHARVLEAAILDAPVVPFRFGTIVPGGDEAVGDELLAARHDELLELLDRFRDHVQMTVKVSFDEDAILREIVESDERLLELRRQARGGDEIATRDIRVALGELIGEALEAHRERTARELTQQLESLTEEIAAEAPENEFMVLNAPCLLERRRQDEFERAVSQLAEENRERIHFALLGPMPVYDFIGSTETAAA